MWHPVVRSRGSTKKKSLLAASEILLEKELNGGFCLPCLLFSAPDKSCNPLFNSPLVDFAHTVDNLKSHRERLKHISTLSRRSLPLAVVVVVVDCQQAGRVESATRRHAAARIGQHRKTEERSSPASSLWSTVHSALRSPERGLNNDKHGSHQAHNLTSECECLINHFWMWTKQLWTVIVLWFCLHTMA